jgi:hypothetical protein
MLQASNRQIVARKVRIQQKNSNKIKKTINKIVANG